MELSGIHGCNYSRTPEGCDKHMYDATGRSVVVVEGLGGLTSQFIF